MRSFAGCVNCNASMSRKSDQLGSLTSHHSTFPSAQCHNCVILTINMHPQTLKSIFLLTEPCTAEYEMFSIYLNLAQPCKIRNRMSFSRIAAITDIIRLTIIELTNHRFGNIIRCQSLTMDTYLTDLNTYPLTST